MFWIMHISFSLLPPGFFTGPDILSGRRHCIVLDQCSRSLGTWESKKRRRHTKQRISFWGWWKKMFVSYHQHVWENSRWRHLSLRFVILFVLFMWRLYLLWLELVQGREKDDKWQHSAYSLLYIYLFLFAWLILLRSGWRWWWR